MSRKRLSQPQPQSLKRGHPPPGRALKYSLSRSCSQEIAVDALPNHLSPTRHYSVQVIERADSLRIREIAKPGDVNVISPAGLLAVGIARFPSSASISRLLW